MAETIISILTYNQVEHTRKCLESVFNNTTKYYRIVVSDNGSTDNTIDYLKSLGNKINLVLNGENLGFTKAHNKIMQMYPKHDIVLMNNDIEVPTDWLENLIAYKDKNGLGAVSAAIQTKNGLDVGAVLDKNAKGRSLINDKSEPHWISGSLMYICRSTIDTIGTLDENFFAYYDDVDYCVRMKKEGIKFGTNWDVVITHLNSASSSSAQKRIMMENSKQYFINKHNWGK
jgi:GT2 family glycosyltransferase